MAGPPTHDSDRSPLSFDELVALFIAFLSIGAVLWWSLGRRAETWIGQSGLLGSRAQTGQVEGVTGQLPGGAVSPTISPTVSPTAISPGGAGSVTTPAVPSPVPEAAIVAPSGTVPDAAAPNAVVPGAAIPSAPVAPAAVPGVPSAIVPVPVPVAPVAPSPVVPAAPAPVAPTIAVPSAAPTAVTFPDVPATYWAYPFITELGRRGMIAGVGDGSFQPDQPVNRAQYAALLSEVLTGPQQGEIPFSDVPAGFWAVEPIDEAVKSGFLKGYPDETFQPTQPITKMQVLLSLANGFQLPKPADPDAAIQRYADQDQIPEWARPAVGAATQAGVVVNYPEVSQFQPNEPATRAEVAAMLYQALKTRGQLPPIQSNYIVQP